MFNVPLGVPLPASILASLISSFASGPVRIGLDAAGAPWPQATPPPRVSTAPIAKTVFRMACPSSVSLVLEKRAELAVPPVRIEAYPHAIAEHVGGEHQQLDVGTGKDVRPP